MQIMAFNFLEIKRLGAMYRAVEEALVRLPNESLSLQKTQDILGRRILHETSDDHDQGFQISVDCQIKRFPQPGYSIGQYVEYEDVPGERMEGLIIGIAYHAYADTPSWWYEISTDPDHPWDTEFAQQGQIGSVLSPWEWELGEEEQATLDTFLRHFEESYGPLFPPEEDVA